MKILHKQLWILQKKYISKEIPLIVTLDLQNSLPASLVALQRKSPVSVLDTLGISSVAVPFTKVILVLGEDVNSLLSFIH